jgi:hypothetical protein
MPTDTREERPGSPQESVDASGDFKASRQFICPWADRYYIERLLLADGGERYPFRDDINSYCRQVEITPFGSSATLDSGTGRIVHEKALISAAYGVNRATLLQPNPNHAGELFSESYEPTIEFMTLDYRSYQWATACMVPDTVDLETGEVLTWRPEYALQPDQAPGRQMHGGLYTLERHNMSQVPSTLSSLEGTINAAAFSSITFGRTFPAQSCLLLPSPTDVSWALVGGTWTPKVSMRLRIQYKNIPSWNKFWRPDLYDGSDPDSAWDSILDSNEDPVYSYPVASWAALL